MDVQQDDKLMMRMGRVCSMGEDLDILYFMEDSAPIPHFHIVDKRTLGREFHTKAQREYSSIFTRLY